MFFFYETYFVLKVNLVKVNDFCDLLRPTTSKLKRYYFFVSLISLAIKIMIKEIELLHVIVVMRLSNQL